MFCDVEHIVVIVNYYQLFQKASFGLTDLNLMSKPHFGTSSSFTGVWEEGNDIKSVDFCQQLAYGEIQWSWSTTGFESGEYWTRARVYWCGYQSHGVQRPTKKWQFMIGIKETINLVMPQGLVQYALSTIIQCFMLLLH